MRAALLTQLNAPLEICEIHPALLEYGQVRVRVIASGICGAQLQECRGDKGTHFPRLMGHEGVGIVEEIGDGVKLVSAGDRVCMHWRKGDGIECESPCYAIKIDGHWRGDMTGGQVVTFATHSICSENRLTRVADDCPDELALLLGCSLSTALGVIENEANVRFGESVLIIGCGGLGLNLILAAKLRQAGVIWAIDVNHEKLERARGIGADGVWMPEMGGSIGDDFDVVIDTTGNAERLAQGIDLLKPSGRLVMVGQPTGDVIIPNAKRMFEGSGKRIIATQGGRFSPSRDIPRYIAMWRAGRLNLDGLISHRFPLSRINEALDCVRQGLAGRVLIDCHE
ncbi:MAG: zinc-binding dehydrogenase [Collimonas pratensis]|uniref:zinc-binding dehydrogenase n=1 Tax=Collimonas pratensis TaxID=279113 RepID=UPI003C70D8BE